jgi:hypothetical protein
MILMNTDALAMILKHLVGYITQVFKPCTLQGSWPTAKDLPLYLQGGWAYQLVELDGQQCLLMLDEHEQSETAQRLKKTLNKISKYFEGPLIYGVAELASYNRKRLIDQGIAFVVPGKQLYLPFMALDLRENFAAETKADATTLGACAQQLLLMQLHGLWQQDVSAQALGGQLGVSKMTVSRAYRELSEFSLARVTLVGRRSKLVFEVNNGELWNLAQPYLISPVKKQVYISNDQYRQHSDIFQYSAGEQALAQQGMLALPKQHCAAINAADWPSLKSLMGLEEQSGIEDDAVLIQLWRYNPGWLSNISNEFTKQCAIDRISLYLSLQNQKDERIHIALDEMMQEFWKEHRG